MVERAPWPPPARGATRATGSSGRRRSRRRAAWCGSTVSRTGRSRSAASAAERSPCSGSWRSSSRSSSRSSPARTSGRSAATRSRRTAVERPALALVTDEYDTVGLELTSAGMLRAFHLPTGRALAERSLDLGPSPVTAFGRAPAGDFGLGFADGTVRFGTIGFDVSLTADTDGPPASRSSARATPPTARRSTPGCRAGRSAASRPSSSSPRRSRAGPARSARSTCRIGGSVERPTRARHRRRRGRGRPPHDRRA